jgi:DNA gyrase inhibitor GyrI
MRLALLTLTRKCVCQIESAAKELQKVQHPISTNQESMYLLRKQIFKGNLQWGPYAAFRARSVVDRLLHFWCAIAIALRDHSLYCPLPQ